MVICYTSTPELQDIMANLSLSRKKFVGFGLTILFYFCCYYGDRRVVGINTDYGVVYQGSNLIYWHIFVVVIHLPTWNLHSSLLVPLATIPASLVSIVKKSFFQL